MHDFISVVGPTASGKSALALFLAKEFNGEVISFDSMQIYKEMDIGTAKPTKEEMANVPHRMIDIADPRESFSVADFCARAERELAEVKTSGKLPIFCGGTGLYLDSFVNGTDFGALSSDEEYKESLRALCEREGADALHALLCEKDPEAAEKIHKNNIKRVIRALEIIHLSGMTKTEWDKKALEKSRAKRPLTIGLRFRERETLYERIERRVDIMIESGLADEVRSLYTRGLLIEGTTAYDAIGYKEMLAFVKNECTLSEAAEKIKLATRRYAKRQLTWFSRNKDIIWLYPDDYESTEELFAKASKLVRERFPIA